MCSNGIGQDGRVVVRRASLLPIVSSHFSPWAAALAARMRCHVLLKVLGTTVLIGLFFVAYFHLLHHPEYAVRTVPLTSLDRIIPFEPAALFIYLTLWLYVGVGPGLQPDLRALVAYGLWIGGLCATGLVIFLLWPTNVPPMGADPSGSAGFSMLRGVDAAGNAFPSMHVATATFTMLRIRDVWRRIGAPALIHMVNLTWCSAIVLSTLFIKQHVVLDVISGALLGAAFAVASLRAPRLADLFAAFHR
jgi:membrane-associated phospholipid phosphatase